MMSRWWSTALLLLLFCLESAAETIHIAVAANFTPVARELVELFGKEHGHEVKASYGSTGKLYAQIEHGAPFQLLLAADEARPRLAERSGLAVVGSRFTYAVGRLVLWSPESGRFVDGKHYLRGGEFRRIAIANPATAPYGLAARELLDRLGLLPEIDKRLVRGESIAQTFQFVATNNVDAGLVALAQLNSVGEGSRWLVPEEYHEPIRQQAVLLRRGEKSHAARLFLKELRGREWRQLIAGYGYAMEEGAQLPVASCTNPEPSCE